jgi:tetratricopeptide (TPR) repeat protein
VNARAKWLLEAASPNDAEAAFEAGAAALRGGLEADAVPLLRAATKAHPQDAQLWQLLGLAHRGLEDLAPAVEALRTAAGLAPADASIAHGLARAALEAGLPAAGLFERAQRLAPSDGSVLIGRASALFAEGRIAEAMAGLEEQLRRNPGWLPGHATLSRLRWLAGDRQAFTRSFEEALRSAPREVPIWRELIDTLMHAERYEAALGTIGRARAAAGPDPGFDGAEAVATAEKGDIAAADRLFAALGPLRHITMVVRHVRHLLRAGRPEAALAAAEPWIANDPGQLLWPYLAAGWRLTGDERWHWLEGDGRLVGIYDLADRLPDLGALAARLRGLHLASHQPLEQSVRGGTQTDGPLFARIEPEIRALRQAVVEAVGAHVAQLPPRQPGHPTLGLERGGAIRFSGSWSVRLAGGGRHANHIHPAGWFSSALYVALPDEAERGASPAGWLTLGEPQAELGLGLEPFRTVEPKPGRLVLFPSTLWHGTVPFGAGERLTVAFDVARPAE